jgi:YD repeat-containing protein
LRWAAVFILLLLAVSAVPVLAQSPPTEQAPLDEGYLPSASELEELPTSADTAQAIAEVKEREAALRKELESPAAELEREETRYAYASLTASEAAALLTEEFADELAAIDQDPARAISDASVERVLGVGDAIVSIDGRQALLDGVAPVQVPDEDGDLAKVDLALVADGEGGFLPANSLTDLTLPNDLSEGIELGATGLTIMPGAKAGSDAARRLGEKDLLYFEADTDTDILASPVSAGVELFAQLRSEDSPEELRFELDLPAGFELRSDSAGGAEVIRDGSLIVKVPAPYAVDAQGASVPVEMEVEGNVLVLHVAHREEDFARPILVDPLFENWIDSYSWYNGYGLSALDPNGTWTWTTNNGGRLWGQTTPIYTAWGGSNRGLFISATSTSGWQYGGTDGFWTYDTPGGATAYIQQVAVNPFWRNNHANCPAGKYPVPVDYNGIWSSKLNQYITFHLNDANNSGWSMNVPDIFNPNTWTGRRYAIGMSTWEGGPAIPCWRDLYAGGVSIYLNDQENPTLNQLTGIPSGWVSDKTALSINAQTSDPGLGIRRVTVLNEGKGVVAQDPVGNCTGLKAKPCPASWSAWFSPTGNSFGEGIRGASVVVEDAIEKTVTSKFQIKVDRSSPEMTLEGQLAKATKEVGNKEPPVEEDKAEPLSLPVYKLQIKAEDGSTASDLTKRSGVKDIQVFLGKEEMTVPWEAKKECPLTSCKMEQTYTLALSDIDTAGLHVLEVIAVDFAGNEHKRQIEFEYLPATGMRDSYAMHYFSLPDGTGNEEEEEHPDRPELAVNVINGNLVYREQDIEVEGAAVDLEVERYYNSQLPEDENTEWGDGWTLAQTPGLEPEEGAIPTEAEIVDSSGAVDGGVELPEKAGEETFDPELQASIAKEADGGYELTDETGESPGAIAFNEDGRAEALRTEGYAKVDYQYEGGELAEIEIEDPSTFAADPEELDIPSPEPIGKPTYASAFGKNGTADGQLKSPADVAVDSVGNLWVADKANNRIQKFSPDGKFLFKFGSYGSTDGKLSAPAGLAIDSQGNIWVADSGNRRVQKFNAKGEYLAKFGSVGSGDGQFSSWGPRGIAIDAVGNLWVSDYSSRVQRFDATGKFIKAVGSFGQSAGLDVGAGKVWVGDWSNNRVSVISEVGEFLFNFGSYGTGNGQFNHPDTVEVDAQGNVWVGDQSNHRIQQFDSEAKYVAQFGVKGAGDGQFNFTYPLGIETDGRGRLWVADVNNHRIQEWLLPIKAPVYADSFGIKGSADGQLSSPADVAVGLSGALWVADRANNRIQKFGPDGKFLFKFGSPGSSAGQFASPSSLAVDRDGNLLVLDRGNNRVQKFDPAGNFIAKFGSYGIGNGQFNTPEAITADYAGNIWVCDTLNGRIQRFDEEGKFIEVVGSKGSGEGQFGECTGIDVGPDGRVWAGDWQNNRINVFSSEGDYLFRFGTAGSGNGQFSHPDAIEIDGKGNAYVGDQSNHRIQQFDSEAKYVRQFGSYGAGAGQFNFTYPLGIETDSKGHLWVADVNNHRIQRWLTANYAPLVAQPIELTDGDPAVQLESEAGLIASVEGNAAGEHSYEHEGALLVSHEGPEGESVYDYDGAGRMTKVTLPNGTWAQVAYEPTYGRVKSVTVAPEGTNAKTTYFEYTDTDPRRSTVIPPDAPHVTYDIGADGSVLKWWNAKLPPELKLAGTLYDNREKPQPITNGDYWLESQAKSKEGIASIEVVANGSTLVSEEVCEQTEAPGIECTGLIVDEWITSTDLNIPGRLQLEVMTTDRLGESSSERFWVEIPQPLPPPPPGLPVPPKFHDILKFRDEYGLEVVFPVKNETERNERIFNLINAWYEGEPVARATMEKWGVPLRPADVAELEYREWLYDFNAEKIDQWVEATSPGSYAGYYMDHPAGGVMRIGFLGNQAEQLESLETSLSLVGGSSRLGVYPTPPTVSYLTVRDTAQSVLGAIESNPTLADLVVSVEDDEAGKATRVGTSHVAQVEGILDQMLGANAPVAVEYEAGGGALLEGRYRNEGRMRAGDYINGTAYTPGGVAAGSNPCTAGFGAKDRRRKPNGEEISRLFLLAAGHCYTKIDQEVWRAPQDESQDFDDAGKSEVGRVARNAIQYAEYGGTRTDGAAIRIHQGGIVPLAIWGWGGHPLPTKAAEKARKGNVVCYSGAISKTVACGQIVARSLNWADSGEPFGLAGYWVRFPEGDQPKHGDSGSPVWNLRTGASIGLVSAGRPHDSLTETLVAPLLHPPNMPANRVPGILHHMGMEPLQLMLGG